MDGNLEVVLSDYVDMVLRCRESDRHLFEELGFSREGDWGDMSYSAFALSDVARKNSCTLYASLAPGAFGNGLRKLASDGVPFVGEHSGSGEICDGAFASGGNVLSWVDCHPLSGRVIVELPEGGDLGSLIKMREDDEDGYLNHVFVFYRVLGDADKALSAEPPSTSADKSGGKRMLDGSASIVGEDFQEQNSLDDGDMISLLYEFVEEHLLDEQFCSFLRGVAERDGWSCGD